MRNWIYWLFVICLISPVQSYAWMSPIILGGSGNAYKCPEGTYIFAWDGDHSSGTKVGCWDSGAAEVTGSGSLTPSTSYGENGSYGVDATSAETTILWTQTANQYISNIDASQTTWMRVKVITNPTTGYDVYWDAADSEGNDYVSTLVLYSSGSSLWTINYVAEGGSNYTATGPSITTGEWHDVGISWNLDNEGGFDGYNSVYYKGRWAIEDASTVDGAEGLVNIQVGKIPYSTATGEAYIDKVFVVDGYQALVPWGADELINSNFEGYADQQQWSTSGTVDLNFATGYPNYIPAYGSRLARLDAGASIVEDLTELSDEVTLMTAVIFADALENTEYHMAIRNSSDTSLCQAMIFANGEIKAFDGTTIGSAATTDVDIIPLLPMWLRLYYKKGTGSNSECEASIWNGSSWDTSSVTGGSNTDQADNVRLANYQDGTGVEYWYYDEVHALSGDYDSDPIVKTNAMETCDNTDDFTDLNDWEDMTPTSIDLQSGTMRLYDPGNARYTAGSLTQYGGYIKFQIADYGETSGDTIGTLMRFPIADNRQAYYVGIGDFDTQQDGDDIYLERFYYDSTPDPDTLTWQETCDTVNDTSIYLADGDWFATALHEDDHIYWWHWTSDPGGRKDWGPPHGILDTTLCSVQAHNSQMYMGIRGEGAYQKVDNVCYGGYSD